MRNQKGNLIKTFNHNGRVSGISISKDNFILISGGWDNNKIKIWNIQSGELLQTIEEDSSYIWRIEYSSDQKLLANTSD